MDISELISRSIGGYSIGSILSALLTFLIYLIVVRLVMKLCARLLSRANRLNERLQKVILMSLQSLLYLLTIIITAEALGIDAVIKGIDLPVHAPAEDYRAVVEFIKHDPLSMGALVTTHKIDIYNAAKDLLKRLGMTDEPEDTNTNETVNPF